MITKFKIFESISKSPELGDYVIVDFTSFKRDDELLYDLYLNNVGQIVGVNSDESMYDVKWENAPKFEDKFRKNYFGRLGNTRQYHIDWFVCWSDNKKELEEYLSDLRLKEEAIKYNL